MLVFSPEKNYERIGDVPNIVYTCGTLVRDDEIWLCYGAADAYVGLARGKLSALLQLLVQCPLPYAMYMKKRGPE